MPRDVRAHLRYLHMSPRKVRRVANVLRGLSAARAEAELLVRPERAALPLRKLLRSAIANAQQLADVLPEQMTIAQLTVDGGPRLKRYRPRSRGMAHPITRQMSHVSLVLRIPDTVRRREVRRDASQETASSVTSERALPQREDRRRDRPEGGRRQGSGARAPRLPAIGRRFFQRKSV